MLYCARITVAQLVFVLAFAFTAATRWGTGQAWVHAHLAAEEREPAVNSGKRTSDARNRQCDVFDPAHVLTRVVEIEHPLGDFDLAVPSRLDLENLQREV
jgi:hypothetical protein